MAARTLVMTEALEFGLNVLSLTDSLNVTDITISDIVSTERICVRGYYQQIPIIAWVPTVFMMGENTNFMRSHLFNFLLQGVDDSFLERG